MNEEDGNDFLKDEYQSLRGEILKRTELQHQLISIAVVAFGSLLAIGFGKDGSPRAILAYPLLTVALSAAWSQHDIRIKQLGTYIKEHIEAELLGEGRGWEHLLSRSAESDRVGKRTIWSTRTILLITPILAVILSRFKIGAIRPVDAGDWLLTGMGVLCIAVTFYLFRRIKTTADKIGSKADS